MARASRKATEEQIRASQVAFDGTKEEATLGARTTLDVLNAEQDLLNAKASLISALADEQVAAYRLLAQMGQLTVDHLNLPVQKYDPAHIITISKTPQRPATRQSLGPRSKGTGPEITLCVVKTHVERYPDAGKLG